MTKDIDYILWLIMDHSTEFFSRCKAKFFLLLNWSTTDLQIQSKVDFIGVGSISLPVVFFKALATLKMDMREVRKIHLELT